MVPLKEAIAKVEKGLILEALEASGWIQARAARALGISQRVLNYKIKKYGILLKPGREEEKRNV